MLTTLVFATTATTLLFSLIALATLKVDAENFWDPRTQVRAAASLVRSCLQHSQLLVSGCWSQVSRASHATKTRFSQRLNRAS